MWNNQIHTTRHSNTNHFIASSDTFYSQYSQDRSLENTFFQGFKNGIFMDVGAHDGVDLNNTLFFETTHNWTGINIESIKNVYDRLVTNRPNCININCAISDTDGTAEFLWNVGYTEMLSGLKSEYDKQHVERIEREQKIMGGESKTIIVETKTIESICDKHNIKHIHYLSIDVEGGEMKVLKSINFEKVFIDIIAFENNYNYKTPEEYLSQYGYVKLPQHAGDIFMIHKASQFYKVLPIS